MHFYDFYCSNRFDYDKKMSELSCADDDHPLKQTDGAMSNHSESDGCGGVFAIKRQLISSSIIIIYI